MFVEIVEAGVGLTDGELDDAIRASELAAREQAARRAVLIAIAESRGVYRTDGHRTMKSYLRATCNSSGAEISRQRKLARLLSNHPAVGDALLAGRVSVDHAIEIARVLANHRVAHLLGTVIDVFVEMAEHVSFDAFRAEIDTFIRLTDLDGGFVDVANNVEHRTARVNDVGGTLDVVASGGDPITAMQMVAVFESFVEGEYRRDVEERRALYGDDADQYPLARTAAQRRYDALKAIFAAAATSPEGRALPEPTVHIVIDHESVGEAFATAAITLPNGDQVELDELGECDSTMLTTLAGELVDDPEAFRSRRCETSSGAAISPIVALQAAFVGHIRRVVVDSDGVVINYGTKQRLFTGNARTAAQLLTRFCTHPGCRLPARMCQIDHNDEWVEGGRTDQRNANVECGPHNRFKHRERWRTRRDRRGRVYHLRPDGTIVLPVGERPPDLSIDELSRSIRARLAGIPR
jgi:hypothetical protein